MQSPYLTFGPSTDAVGRAVLVLGVVALVTALVDRGALAARFEKTPSRAFVALLAAGAFLLSYGYLGHYLAGGPRIVDATSYFLQARALAQGDLEFGVPLPSGSFRGRFTLFHDGALSVIFPPGYPLALALGFLVHAPLLVGPIIAGLLVVATYLVTRDILRDERAARVAATVSLLSAALRYHTADTMSHGFSGLLVAVSLVAALRPSRAGACVAGLAVGWLAATRPVTGGIVLLFAFTLLARMDVDRRARVAAFALTLVPGVLLVALHQHAATGSFSRSTQLAYYALADGPPGCFGWGFGERGCHFEHGDFVKEELARGFGVVEAAKITMLRLLLHVSDIANFAPLGLLVPVALVRFRKEPGVLPVGLTAMAVIAGYLPYYFPGSYPGGGARLYADVLPLEHALLGLSLARFRIARFLPALALLGFAFHGVHAHEALKSRDGGRPMFEPSVLEAAKVRSGLVFVGTDHGFSLGHDPAAHDARRAVVVARERGGAHDFALFEALGRPPTYRYDFSVETGVARLVPYRPERPEPYRAEGEAEWPPLSVERGWAHPDFRSCLSRGRGLHLRASPDVMVALELVPPHRGDYDLSVGWLADRGTTLDVRVGSRTVRVVARGDDCERTLVGRFRMEPGTKVSLRTPNALIIDYLDLERDPPEPATVDDKRGAR
jgi:hypothetical protein